MDSRCERQLHAPHLGIVVRVDSEISRARVVGQNEAFLHPLAPPEARSLSASLPYAPAAPSSAVRVAPDAPQAPTASKVSVLAASEAPAPSQDDAPCPCPALALPTLLHLAQPFSPRAHHLVHPPQLSPLGLAAPLALLRDPRAALEATTAAAAVTATPARLPRPQRWRAHLTGQDEKGPLLLGRARAIGMKERMQDRSSNNLACNADAHDKFSTSREDTSI
eukprot:6203347-Pleurochrysis_carterae.AAC.5